MLTNQQAISRLRKRGEYVQRKIDELTAEGKPVFWFLQDLEAVQIGIAAIEYVIAMEAYEASQSSALESSSG